MRIGTAISIPHATPNGARWNPLAVSNCVLWLRADLGITLNGSDVSAWADQSVRANNAAQSTASAQPAYLSGGWSNGHPTVSFTAANSEFMDIATWTQGAADNYSVFAVLDLKSAGALNQYILSNNTGGIGVQAHHASNGPGVFDGTAHRKVASAVTGQQKLTWTIDASGTPTITFYRNGSSLGTDSYDGTLTFATADRLGRFGSSAVQYLDAELAELIVYDRVVTAAERGQIDAYTLGRFGV